MSLLPAGAVLGPAVVVGGAFALGLLATDATPNPMAVQTQVDSATITNPPNTFLIKQLYEAYIAQRAVQNPSMSKYVFARLYDTPVVTVSPDILSLQIVYIDTLTNSEGINTVYVYSTIPADYQATNGIPPPTPIQGYVMST